MARTSNPETPDRPELPKELRGCRMHPCSSTSLKVGSFYDSVVAPVGMSMVGTRGEAASEYPGNSRTIRLRGRARMCSAAEIEGKGVVELYSDIAGAKEAGKYPEPEASESAEKLRDRRREYWSVFRKHFSATKAMVAVEKAAGAGRIRWIDYRLPITDRGDTLHSHCCPGGHYDQSKRI